MVDNTVFMTDADLATMYDKMAADIESDKAVVTSMFDTIMDEVEKDELERFRKQLTEPLDFPFYSVVMDEGKELLAA
jgi:hypothetical protein